VTHGWSLFLVNGELCFATTHEGKRTVVRSGTQVNGQATIVASLDDQGRVRLSVDGREVHSAMVPGLLDQQPLDGLQVGQDIKGAVGNYESPFELHGNVASVLIKIQK
jgi:arylsulfatase